MDIPYLLSVCVIQAALTVSEFVYLVSTIRRKYFVSVLPFATYSLDGAASAICTHIKLLITNISYTKLSISSYLELSPQLELY